MICVPIVFADIIRIESISLKDPVLLWQDTPVKIDFDLVVSNVGDDDIPGCSSDMISLSVHAALSVDAIFDGSDLFLDTHTDLPHGRPTRSFACTRIEFKHISQRLLKPKSNTYYLLPTACMDLLVGE